MNDMCLAVAPKRPKALLRSGYQRSAYKKLEPGRITRGEWLRFLHYVKINGMCHCTPDFPHSTWTWIGTRNHAGYGVFVWRGRRYLAHRFAVIALGQLIAPGFEPDHLCRDHACVNTACIEVVTKRVNSLRGVGICARQARQTHCQHGHPLEGKNLLTGPLARGHRVCRTCFNAWRRDKKRAEILARHGGILPGPATHCRQGHEFTPGNTIMNKDGRRRCRLCQQARWRAYDQRKRSTPIEELS